MRLYRAHKAAAFAGIISIFKVVSRVGRSDFVSEVILCWKCFLLNSPPAWEVGDGWTMPSPPTNGGIMDGDRQATRYRQQ